jgi:hypothetical protein
MSRREEKINREKVPPLLLRVFIKDGGHHEASDFAVRGQEPKDEIHIYTWFVLLALFAAAFARSLPDCK